MHLFRLISKARRFFILISIVTVVGLTGYWLIFQNVNQEEDEDLKLKLNESRRILINPCVFEKNHPNARERFPKCIYDEEPSMLSDASEGRLGNRMSMYAVLFALSQYNHRPAFMSPNMSDFISLYFKVSMNTLNPSLYNRIKWSRLDVRGYGYENYSIRNITKKPFVRIHGWAHSWKYYDEIRPQILKEFRFHDYIVKSTKSLLQNIRNEFMVRGSGSDGDERSKVNRAIMIGVHVRRGDYVKLALKQKFYLPTAQFYEGAMEYLEAKYGNHGADQSVIFVVGTDDDEWCKENLIVLKKFQIHILKGAPEEMPGLDLAILSTCDHVIFGHGSFGYWVGYLNFGEVVYCSTCITPNSSFLAPGGAFNGDYRNFIPPRWTGFSLEGKKTDYSVLPKRLS